MVLGSGVAASSAGAETKWFTDKSGDVKASIDLQKVQVANGSEHGPGIKVVVVQRTLLGGDWADVWIDVDPSDPGPEYVVGWISNTDAFGLREAESFSQLGKVLSCPRMRIMAGEENPGEYSRVWLPRGCIGSPDQVQVSVRTGRHVGHDMVFDWGPAVHQFYPWVDRG